MIQQQTYVDICDNTGAKTGMCIKVLRGSSSKGKFKRKVAHVGDIIICAADLDGIGAKMKMGIVVDGCFKIQRAIVETGDGRDHEIPDVKSDLGTTIFVAVCSHGGVVTGSGTGPSRTRPQSVH